VADLEQEERSSDARLRQLVKGHRQLLARSQAQSRAARAAESKAAAVARGLQSDGHHDGATNASAVAGGGIGRADEGAARQQGERVVTFLESQREKVTRLESVALAASKGACVTGKEGASALDCLSPPRESLADSVKPMMACFLLTNL
jgi:hypothetical protein